MMPATHPHASAEALAALQRLSGCHLPGRLARRSSAEATLPIIDPGLGVALGAVADQPDCEVDATLATASAAWRPWAALSALERASLLHEVARRIRARQRLIAEVLTLEMGKPFKESMDEVDWSITAIDYYAEIARHDNGRVLGNTVPGQMHLVTKEPLGVVAIIMPFNYPLVLLAWQCAAALGVGNAVVVKPSELTTVTTLLFLECFEALPEGVVTCVTGGGRVGARLGASPATQMVAFTGSVPTARAVAVSCADTFKRCLIEASGNDAFIVMPSAPLDVAVAAATFAAFLNCGQVCTSAERFYVHRDVHDRFVEAFAAAAAALRIGHGLGRVDLGPMASERERTRFEAVLARAIEQGARVVTGGRRPPHLTGGFFHEPTVLADVDPTADVMQHEPFGPLAAVCRVEDFDEALLLANRSRYGLGANVYTTDLGEVARAMAELETGLVWVNAPLLDNAAGPFGGRKLSGIGRQLGSEGLDQFRETKLVMIDPTCSRQSFWWFPYADAEAFSAPPPPVG